MFEALKAAWDRGGEWASLDKKVEMLIRDMIHSEKGSPERQAAVDVYIAFIRNNLDYTANRRGWKERGEEEDRANIEKLQKLYTDREVRW